MRQAKGLSQEALAHDAEISMRYLAGLERGEENPTIKIVVSLAKALGVEPGRLIDEDQGHQSRD